MRDANAKAIRRKVYEECQKIAHPHPKMIYQRVKKAFLATPRPLRNRFNPATGTVS